MTIECYYSSCPHHGCNEVPPEEGPFCFEVDCRATPEQIKQYATERRAFLEKCGYTPCAIHRDGSC